MYINPGPLRRSKLVEEIGHIPRNQYSSTSNIPSCISTFPLPAFMPPAHEHHQDSQCLISMFSFDPQAWFHFLCHSAYILRCILQPPHPKNNTSLNLYLSNSPFLKAPIHWTCSITRHLSVRMEGTPLDQATQHPFLCPWSVPSPPPLTLSFGDDPAFQCTEEIIKLKLPSLELSPQSSYILHPSLFHVI